MENSFTAIDFETAQGKRWSICQIGLVRIDNGQVTHTYSKLIRPPFNFYWERFIQIHGITPQMTKDAPTFDSAWKEIEEYITDQTIVAHNGFAFDFPCLQNTLGFYGIDTPVYNGRCTYQIFKTSLAALCKEYGINLIHHDALSDAMACAKLYLLHNSKRENSENKIYTKRQ